AGLEADRSPEKLAYRNGLLDVWCCRLERPHAGQARTVSWVKLIFVLSFRSCRTTLCDASWMAVKKFSADSRATMVCPWTRTVYSHDLCVASSKTASTRTIPS